MTQNEIRTYIRDYLNGMYKEEELLMTFELKKCSCGNYELEDDMEETNAHGLKCLSCRNDL